MILPDAQAGRAVTLGSSGRQNSLPGIREDNPVQDRCRTMRFPAKRGPRPLRRPQSALAGLDRPPRPADNADMTPETECDREIDARGLRCPLPVLRAQKVLRGMAPGEVLALIADDPMAAIDLPHFCAQTGHMLLSTREAGTARLFLIRRAAVLSDAPSGEI